MIAVVVVVLGLLVVVVVVVAVVFFVVVVVVVVWARLLFGSLLAPTLASGLRGMAPVTRGYIEYCVFFSTLSTNSPKVHLLHYLLAPTLLAVCGIPAAENGEGLDEGW